MAYAAAAAGILKGVGDIMGGEATAQGDEYNSKVNLENARITRQQTIAQATQQARENYLRLGDMRAAIGKSGGVGGSFLDVLADSAAQGELAKQNIIYAGSVKATNQVRGALLDMSSATSAGVGSYFQAGSDLLMAGGSAGAFSSGSMKRS